MEAQRPPELKKPAWDNLMTISGQKQVLKTTTNPGGGFQVIKLVLSG
jgi:hypothetical protein